MAKKYRHLSVEEREKINLLRVQGKSLREIGRLVGRSDATISRELKRNAPSRRPGRYLAHKAQSRYQKRLSLAHSRSLMKNRKIRNFVVRGLKDHLSPELIAGRLPLELPGHSISHETIYQWVYKEAREFIPYLVRAHKRRKRKGQGKRHKNLHIPNRTGIEKRPRVAEVRKEVGHWEADTVVSRASPAALNVLVERVTRLCHIRRVRQKTAKRCSSATSKCLRKHARAWRKTVTYDNGPENVLHETVNREAGTHSYFCRPYHSWEKGTAENVIGLIRRFWPKKSDFSGLRNSQIKSMESRMNRRPRKCLGFKTPLEAYRRASAALKP